MRDLPRTLRPLRSGLPLLLLGALLAGAGGCQAMLDDAYYGTMERFGVEKRHILADRVEEGREDQREAQEQFQTTLEAFRAVTGFQGGDLEDAYERFRDDYEESERRAQEVRDRIASIERVAQDLFAEWEKEIGEISSPDLRRGSRERLRETRASYDQLIRAMRAASARMDPVLTAFHDRVLFLKHNLNAQAIASLKTNLAAIETDVERLIRDMNTSIAEAERFLGTIEK